MDASYQRYNLLTKGKKGSGRNVFTALRFPQEGQEMGVTTNPLVVDKAFVMANYSQLEPLVRKQMKEIRLRGVTARFEYSSEDVDEDIQMEGPPGFQLQPSTNTEIQATQNLPPLLPAHHREIEQRRMTFSPTYAPVVVQQNKGFNGANGQHGGFHSQGAHNPPSMPHQQNMIEKYQFPDGLKVPPHIKHYAGKGDLDNFLHVFEGAMRMEKWTMPIKRLNRDQRIAGFVHGIKVTLLVKLISTDLLKSYDSLMEKTYTWLQEEEIASEGWPVVFMYSNNSDKM
ncbi:hypothetical protein Tco_0648899 [Tanacetum coccineum]